MKRSYSTIIRVILAACAMAIAAGYQSYAQVDINIKFIKKEARELKKKGYKPLPGYPSIEDQCLAMARFKVDDGDLMHLHSSDVSIGEHENLDYAIERAIMRDIDAIVEEFFAAVSGISSSNLLDNLDPKRVAPSWSKVDSVKVDLFDAYIDDDGHFFSIVKKHLYLNGEVCGTVTESYDEQSSCQSVTVVFDQEAYQIVREVIKPVIGMFYIEKGKYKVAIQQVVSMPKEYFSRFDDMWDFDDMWNKLNQDEKDS